MKNSAFNNSFIVILMYYYPDVVLVCHDLCCWRLDKNYVPWGALVEWNVTNKIMKRVIVTLALWHGEKKERRKQIETVFQQFSLGCTI